MVQFNPSFALTSLISLIVVVPEVVTMVLPFRSLNELNPLPFLDGDGPTAAVTALTFSPDGQTLYSAGYDKVVRVWEPARDWENAVRAKDGQKPAGN